MHKAILISFVLILINSSCSKSGSTSSGNNNVTGNTLYFTYTVNNKTVSYGFSRTGCVALPSQCSYSPILGGVEYVGNTMLSNSMSGTAGTTPCIGGAEQSNCNTTNSNPCFSAVIYLDNISVGTHTSSNVQISEEGNNTSIVYLGGTGLTGTSLTVKITRSDNLGGLIQGTFSGILKQDTTSNLSVAYHNVNITGSFSVYRSN